MKIFGHERKPGKDGQIGVVQHVHMYVGNIDRKVSGDETIPHCKATYKGVAHFELLRVYRFCLGLLGVKYLSRVSNFLFLFLLLH